MKLFQNIKSLANLHVRYINNACLTTPLHNFHLNNEATMTEFAGYSMPLKYKSHSIIDSHNWVREKCGMFDVSHMYQFNVYGLQREQFMHSLIVSDLSELPNDMCSLSLFTNDQGGIMDDLIVSNCLEDNHYYVVSNAGCADKIKAHLGKSLKTFQGNSLDVRIMDVSNGLIALQGPLMTKVLQPGLTFPLSELYFGSGRYCSVFGINSCRVTRCGYTGEDGVEISVPKNSAMDLAERLNSHDDVIPIGLGARDTLRLEAGLCLYGNDIDETTTPGEASLIWTIFKSRRKANSKVKFPGFEVIMSEIKKEKPIKRKRIGMVGEGPPARSGVEIISADDDNHVIGHVTSGCHSPYLRLNISMGYIDRKYSNKNIKFRIRGKLYSGAITKLPFVPTHYYTN